MSEPSKKAKGGDFSLRVDPKLVSALSHPLRVHIIDALGEAPASPSDLAREVGLSVNYVAYHVKELEKLGYVELVKTEPRRGTVEHYYQLTRRILLDDAEWERLPEPIKVSFSTDLLATIIDDAKEALAGNTFNSRGSHLSRTRLLVDSRGWEEIMGLLSTTLERVIELQAEYAERLEGRDEMGIPVVVSLAGFEMPPRPRPDSDAPAAD